MQPLRFCLLAVPVIAGLAVPLASPAEAHRRHGGGAALITGLIGLGAGALASGALSGRSDRDDGQGYDEPTYAPQPSYGYAVPAYVARPHVVYAPPPVYYAPPPVAYYAPPPGYNVPPGYQGGPAYARWSDDD